MIKRCITPKITKDWNCSEPLKVRKNTYCITYIATPVNWSLVSHCHTVYSSPFPSLRCVHCHPDSVLCLQPGSFPARCRNSRGNTKLLGRENQTIDIIPTHLTLLLSIDKTRMTLPSSIPPKPNNNAPIMVIMVWKVLCFDWLTRSLSPPTSPGPGRLRVQRTERLQKQMTTKAKPEEQKYITVINPPLATATTHAHKDNSSQTHPMLIFMIMRPFLFFRPK